MKGVGSASSCNGAPRSAVLVEWPMLTSDRIFTRRFLDGNHGGPTDACLFKYWSCACARRPCSASLGDWRQATNSEASKMMFWPQDAVIAFFLDEPRSPSGMHINWFDEPRVDTCSLSLDAGDDPHHQRCLNAGFLIRPELDRGPLGGRSPIQLQLIHDSMDCRVAKPTWLMSPEMEPGHCSGSLLLET